MDKWVDMCPVSVHVLHPAPAAAPNPACLQSTHGAEGATNAAIAAVPGLQVFVKALQLVQTRVGKDNQQLNVRAAGVGMGWWRMAHCPADHGLPWLSGVLLALLVACVAPRPGTSGALASSAHGMAQCTVLLAPLPMAACLLISLAPRHALLSSLPTYLPACQPCPPAGHRPHRPRPVHRRSGGDRAEAREGWAVPA